MGILDYKAVQCSKCGMMIRRANGRKDATCFECRQQIKRVRARMKKVVNISQKSAN